MWGAIFDFDGVIVDSASYHEESWKLLAKEEGKAFSADQFLRGFGRKNNFIIPEILRWTQDDVEVERLSKRKEELYRRLIQEDAIEALPGVAEWLEELRDEEVPCVIASSTELENIKCVLAATGLEECFPAMVSAEDVHHGKPNPEVFVLAAKKIGVAPKNCVVFEDAPVGIEAAKAAGMKVVGVATTHPVEELEGLVDCVVHQLDELVADDIEGWFCCSTQQ